MDFLLVKYIHIAAVVVTSTLFLWRWYLTVVESDIMQQLWVKVLPHVNDSIILVSGVTMIWMSRQYPTNQPWLAAKILAILIYILLASVAIKYGYTRRWRLIAGILAVLCLWYIMMIAINKSVILFS
ncbi:hypothetical protein TI04_03375 [Achromatium sp. WMS2]|nr:hypothetical protein TI04_03375 [Achromatium sp. WMS2]